MGFRSRIAAALLSSLMLCAACAADPAANPALDIAPGRASCSDIAADSHWTGLVLNPPGHATGYYRARCIQQVAGITRNAQLCSEVRERESWLFDGSGTSPAACTRNVDRQVLRDHQAARELRSPQRPTRVSLHQNGNGRDIDMVIGLSGGSGSGLWLTLEAIGRDGRQRRLRSLPQPLDDAPGELTLTLSAADVTRALGAPMPSGPVTLRVTLARRLRSADERAAHALAPHIQLSSRIETRVALDRLARAPLTTIGASAD